MAENNYPIPENPVFNMNIRALQDSDPASASTIFNPLIERLIENLCALKLLLDGKVGADGMQEALTDINDALSGINTALAGKAAANHGHNAATAQAAGFMAAADKAKLDGVAAGATANTASGATPKALGTATPGSLAGFSRGDHVHPKPSPADIGAAAANHAHSGYAGASHNHDAGNITSGILPIARGGLGNDSGYVRAGQKAGTTIGGFCTAEGLNTTASDWVCHAEGDETVASGDHSHAEGNHTTASGGNSHSEGVHTIASGSNSHAEGCQTTASGTNSHAEGEWTIANSYCSHAIGHGNKEMASNDAFVIGKGTSINR